MHLESQLVVIVLLVHVLCMQDEFCSYMQLEYTEMEESVTRTKQVAFTLPATIKALCHGEPILKVHCTPDGTVITLREDGAVYYWTSELQLKKSKTVFVWSLIK